MRGTKGWNRRQFVQLVGYSGLSSAGLCSSLLGPSDAASAIKFAYVASERDEIHVYAARGGEWQLVQTVASEKPVALTIGRGGKALYAVNEVALHRGLPTGTVEAFAIGADGKLKKLNRRELALSATMPRHAAVSPDGKSLVVAVREGGAYNLLPIAEDGSLGRVSGLLKEIGVERSGNVTVAQPRMVAFDTAGRVLTADGGTGRLSVLRRGDDGLKVHARLDPPETAATQLAVHPKGGSLYAMYEDGIACYGYDAGDGRIGDKQQQVRFACAKDGSLAIHRSGNFIYANDPGGGVALWAVSGTTGTLKAVGLQGTAMGELRAIELAPNGASLVGVGRDGRVMEAALDAKTGQLGTCALRAKVGSAKCVALV
jgi:6-phosphogluconolactonase (cycloisomerase 2 family)